MTIIKLSDRWPTRFENDSFYCPICGIYIRSGSHKHRCGETRLKNIEKKKKSQQTHMEKELADPVRTFHDTMEEARYFKRYDTDKD